MAISATEPMRIPLLRQIVRIVYMKFTAAHKRIMHVRGKKKKKKNETQINGAVKVKQLQAVSAHTILLLFFKL